MHYKILLKHQLSFYVVLPLKHAHKNYNPHILRLWKANMDLQYTSSPYAAIAYITSYVTKDEREVGTVLRAVGREMR